MSKMDDFMKKRLTDYTAAKNEWNLPSEDFWEVAQHHFPEKKKKKRTFWLPFALAGITAFCFLAFYLNNNKKQVPTIEKMELATVKTEEKSEVVVKNYSLDNKNIDIQNKSEHISSKSKEIPPSRTTKLNNSNTQINTATAFQSQETIKFDKNNSSVQNGKGNSTVQEDLIPSAISEIIIAENVLAKIDMTEKIDSRFDNPNSLKKDRNINSIPTLSKSESQLIKKEYHHNIPLIPITKGQSMIPTNEFGIGYTEILMGGKRWEEVFVNNNQREVQTSGNYFNLNLHYQHWFRRNWSWSTGVDFSSLSIAVDFSTSSDFENDTYNNVVNNELNNLLENRSRGVVSDGEVLNIELLDHVEVKDIDRFNFDGNVGLSYGLVQFPFLIHYHIYKRKFEYNFGLGASLDFINVIGKDVELSLYTEDMLINKPVESTAESISNLDFSIYAHSGLRYFLTKNINLGLAAKINVRYPLFSGIELGANYRFFK